MAQADRHDLTLDARAFHSSSPKIWNSLPLYIRQSPSILTFRKYLKHFLSLYSLPLTTSRQYVLIPSRARRYRKHLLTYLLTYLVSMIVKHSGDKMEFYHISSQYLMSESLTSCHKRGFLPNTTSLQFRRHFSCAFNCVIYGVRLKSRKTREYTVSGKKRPP